MHEMQTIVTDVCGVCLSVTNALNDPGSASLCGVIGGGACSVRRVPCARGYSVQPSPNAFGLLFYFLTLVSLDAQTKEQRPVTDKQTSRLQRHVTAERPNRAGLTGVGHLPRDRPDGRRQLNPGPAAVVRCRADAVNFINVSSGYLRHYSAACIFGLLC